MPKKMTICNITDDDILTGRARQEFGLDTSSGSTYMYLRMRGASDLEAQREAYNQRCRREQRRRK